MSTTLNGEIQNLPDIETFKNNLKGLSDTNKSSWSQKDISEFYTEKVGILPNLGLYLPSVEMNTSIVYRVRKNVDESEDISLPKTFSYPCPKFCTDNGRANLKSKPVFYCSLFEGKTAIKEAKLNKGDIAYLGIWNLEVNRNSNYTVFFPPSLPSSNKWNMAAKKYYNDFISSINNDKIDKSKQIEMIYLFLAEIFIKEEKPYALTSWISDKMIYEKRYDFMVYPSFQLDSGTCNLAFNTDYVDNYFKLKQVVEFEILEIINSGPLSQDLRIGTVDSNNKIVW